MRAWASGAVGLAIAAWIAACGSSGTRTGSGGYGGYGGYGGSPASTATSTTGTVSTTGFQSTSSGGHTGSTTGPGGGQGGAGGGAGGGGASTCDNTGMCGQGTPPSGCEGCALQGPCAADLTACQTDMKCVQFAQCLQACPMGMAGDACATGCQKTNPQGATTYGALATCVFCQQCPNDCNGKAAGCP